MGEADFHFNHPIDPVEIITTSGALIASIVSDAFFGAPPLWIFPGLGQVWVLRRVSSKLASDFKDLEAMGPALAAYVPQLQQLATWPMRRTQPEALTLC